MVSLLDIAGLSEKVTIRGQEIEVRGITAHGLAILLKKYPDLRKVVSGIAVENLNAAVLVDVLPEAAVQMICAGTGSPGNDKAEEVARNLSVGEQIALLEPIWQMSFPQGITSFTQALERVATRAVGGVSGRAPDTKSPGLSPNVSEKDIQKESPGVTH